MPEPCCRRTFRQLEGGIQGLGFRVEPGFQSQILVCVWGLRVCVSVWGMSVSVSMYPCVHVFVCPCACVHVCMYDVCACVPVCLCA